MDLRRVAGRREDAKIFRFHFCFSFESIHATEISTDSFECFVSLVTSRQNARVIGSRSASFTCAFTMGTRSSSRNRAWRTTAWPMTPSTLVRSSARISFGGFFPIFILKFEIWFVCSMRYTWSSLYLSNTALCWPSRSSRDTFFATHGRSTWSSTSFISWRYSLNPWYHLKKSSRSSSESEAPRAAMPSRALYIWVSSWRKALLGTSHRSRTHAEREVSGSTRVQSGSTAGSVSLMAMGGGELRGERR
mmetsp:Transcript_28622/g.71837  ORF Transcript_28622/g.71837 Transcript_28622/m.71837 type:complete len:248 (-) Transcript_28622:38-781(-)